MSSHQAWSESLMMLLWCAGPYCSSMMAQRVAINNLADSYMAFNTNYHDTGLFGFYATADPSHQPIDDLVSFP